MTVGVQTLYPVPLKENGLLENYRTHCPEYKVPERTLKDEVASLIKELESKPGFDPNLKFDPKKHLTFKPEYYKTTKKFTLSDLKINKTHVKPLNSFGAAFPFPLLNQEAIDMIKWEAFQPYVIENYARLPNLSKDATRLDFHIGGHLSDCAPFTKAVTLSPEIAEIVSNFVGHKLSPVYEMDVVQINACLASRDSEEQLMNYPQTQEEIDNELRKQDASDGDEIPSTLGMHYDSISVPLVIMLDLPEEAQGGQTTIITGDEKATRVPEPSPGYATLIQGRVLRHLASKPVTNHNRISFVVSYASNSPDRLDNCVMTSTKPSVLPKNRYDKFYRDWVEYKFQMLENHMKYVREKVVDEYNAGNGFDQENFVEKCQELEEYLHGVYREMECVHNPPYPPPYFKTPYAEL